MNSIAWRRWLTTGFPLLLSEVDFHFMWTWNIEFIQIVTLSGSEFSHMVFTWACCFLLFIHRCGRLSKNWGKLNGNCVHYYFVILLRIVHRLSVMEYTWLIYVNVIDCVKVMMSYRFFFFFFWFLSFLFVCSFVFVSFCCSSIWLNDLFEMVVSLLHPVYRMEPRLDGYITR